MDGRTHIAWSLAAGIALLHIYPAPLHIALAVLLAAIAGGIAPDLDHPRSFAGKYFKIVNYGARHRGFMHSIGAIILIISLQYAGRAPDWLFVPFLCGYLTHLLLDALTPAGICPLHPLRLGRIRGPLPGSGLAGFAMFLAGLGLAALAIVSHILI